ncbi:LysR substrate-binding domain-containing protein [Salidesulfovibrio brasiliensis]
MELRHLRYFMAVAEELHFGRAARRLHVSQPPLSRQIRQLEEELDVELFERSSRKVELTEAGRYYMAEVGKAMALLDEAGQTVRSVAKGEEGSLKVGFVGPAACGSLPAVVREFRRRYPNIRLTIRAMSTFHQLGLLAKGRLDAGFSRLYGHDTHGMKTRLFQREAYALAVPRDHALAGRERVDLAELDGEDMIFYPRHYQPKLHDALIAAFDRAGATPNIVQEANTEQSTLALVAAGMGVALVPSSSVNGCPSGVSILPLDGTLPPWEVTIVWPEHGHGPIMERLLEVAGEFCRVDDA